MDKLKTVSYLEKAPHQRGSLNWLTTATTHSPHGTGYDKIFIILCAFVRQFLNIGVAPLNGWK
jgi:hypothetical protein